MTESSAGGLSTSVVAGLAVDIEFCLLGPLCVRSGGAVVPVAAGKKRAVLAALLLAAGRVVLDNAAARAHDGLACARHAAGEPDQARRHWQEALARYAGPGVPEARIVRDRLAALAGPS